MSQMVDMRGCTADDREMILGREFRELDVWGFKPTPPMRVVLILEGKRVELIGDPQGALATYLGGRAEGAAQ